MKLLLIVVIVVIIISFTVATANVDAMMNNMNLKIEMYKFTNNYGVKANGRCCFASTTNSNSLGSATCERKCLTFFRFCLKLKSNNTIQNSGYEECLSEFETQIIGENTIEKVEFNQTTDLIEFPITNQQIKVN